MVKKIVFYTISKTRILSGFLELADVFLYLPYIKMKKDIILFWIQGSGKGTQAQLLLEKYPYYKYLEPGNVFRAITSNNNIISEYIKDRMKQGKMLDDNLTFDLFNMYYHLLEKDDMILIDGFPRTMPQMYYFFTQEFRNKRDFIGVYFDITREQALERILERAKVQNRVDDLKLETINQRLDLFEQETMPVIKYFDSIGKLITIDATPDVETIFSAMISELESLEQ